MARIDNVNIKGTPYEVGKIATTSDLGVIKVGSGLSITSEGVLSATGGGGGGGSYSAGYGLELSNNTFSVDTSVIQGALIPGSNIAINDNTISATNTTYTAGTGLELAGTVFSVDLTTVATQSDIPTVNNATLTIQKNGTEVSTFSANASSDVTANIEVPVITMTTTDPGEDSSLAANNLLGVYGGDPVILDYSPTEINTGTTWINGSTIYKKTINFGALPNNTSKSVAHSISNLDKTIEMKGYAYNSTDSISCSLPNNGIFLRADDTYVYITTVDNLTSYTESYVTLYYTKSS